MEDTYAVFEEMKQFVQLHDADVQLLVEARPIFARRGAGITDGFYDELTRHKETAAMIEGRVDALKRTHARWMSELFSGEYGREYFENRLRIGATHVRIGLDTWWVEGVMSYLRTAGHAAIFAEIPDREAASRMFSALCKILDLDLLLINIAYSEERLDRLTSFTGMSRRLIERCIRKGA
ncbi:MAG TPA: protoglobin domain-containing protein [Myxococcota bacterium]|nr:protoglobin domain-containing protein [Myxococcota bacterium]